MSCVVGIEHDNKVWLAGDSGEKWGKILTTCRQPKVRITSGLILGVIGDGREVNLVLTWDPLTASGSLSS
jgi:hypothetical protein